VVLTMFLFNTFVSNQFAKPFFLRHSRIPIVSSPNASPPRPLLFFYL
jgi:hypothetical protein